MSIERIIGPVSETPYLKGSDGGGVGDFGCRITHSVVQALITGVVKTLNFDTEDYDTDSMHDPVTNNDRITINRTGIYMVTANVEFAPSSGGVRREGLIRSNTHGIIGAQRTIPASASLETAIYVSSVQALTVGDFLTLEVFQDSGGNLNLNVVGDYSPIFAAQLIVG